MKVEITPGTASGSVCAPPSKSMTHRALICAFLSGGQCKIDNIAYSADITATIGALRTLGADIAQEEIRLYSVKQAVCPIILKMKFSATKAAALCAL